MPLPPNKPGRIITAPVRIAELEKELGELRHPPPEPLRRVEVTPPTDPPAAVVVPPTPPNPTATSLPPKPIKGWTDPRLIAAVVAIVGSITAIATSCGASSQAKEPSVKLDIGYDALRSQLVQQGATLKQLADDVKGLRSWSDDARQRLVLQEQQIVALQKRRAPTPAAKASAVALGTLPPPPEIKSNPPVASFLPRSLDTLVPEN